MPAALGSSDDYFATAVHVELPEGSPIVTFETWVQWPTPHLVEVAFGGTPVDYAVFGGEAGRASLVACVLEICAHITCPAEREQSLCSENSRKKQKRSRVTTRQ